MGIGGFFMHARGGLVTEYMSNEWFENVTCATDAAKDLGMGAGHTTKMAGQAASVMVL